MQLFKRAVLKQMDDCAGTELIWFLKIHYAKLPGISPGGQACVGGTVMSTDLIDI